MSIVQFPVGIPATVGNNPQLKMALFSDSVEAVTTPGYLNQSNELSASPLSDTDIIMALCNYNAQTTQGDFAIYTVRIASANGLITLTAWANEGNVELPVVVGHLAEFVDLEGRIGNSVLKAADVPTVSNALVVDRVMLASAVSPPQIEASSLLITDLINRNVQNSFNVNGALLFTSAIYTAPGGSVITSSQSGIISTDSLTTASGASYTVTITPFTTLNTNAVVMFQLLQRGTNTAGNNILFTYDVSGFGAPIVATIVNANSGALNGTLAFSYFIIR